MLRFIYGDDLKTHPQLARTMFQDRAYQFHERLGWPVSVDDNGEERDQYDAENPLYIIWETAEGRHGGSLRLLPTTGPTMFNDHFLHLSDGAPIKSPLIWECTRFCLARGASARVAAALMLGGGEVMQRFGVEHFVGVFDAPMMRIYGGIGSRPEVIGTSGEGRQKTSVGLWEFTRASQREIGRRAHISPTLMRLWFDRSFGAVGPWAQSA
ncbi:acyl-homoserine-lactone synthase [Rhodalgimonas zhirmunskyi]|uniref:Acyl-homoserine-lactone synthase n=1 Tax=Rhodalgimonas zhirmunskyi TaxID=2964767 RepID=A0AAJ1UEX2_9RHOB|nr:acyl-homoserine-lactone synthase [Rhodoalgimonas zhirmunskyi]MDQ2094682.1 autoinducer synthase [Rhodoalgimonas zhirmunskyi]